MVHASSVLPLFRLFRLNNSKYIYGRAALIHQCIRTLAQREGNKILIEKEYLGERENKVRERYSSRDNSCYIFMGKKVKEKFCKKGKRSTLFYYEFEKSMSSMVLSNLVEISFQIKFKSIEDIDFSNSQ